MYLAITLSRLDDFENACSAYPAPKEIKSWILILYSYEKAIELESDHIFEINYAITLYNKGELEKSKKHFSEFERLFNTLDEESKNADPDVLEKRQQLLSVLTTV